ncbi:Vascular endothelial growth factor A-A [Frankliniella fusca]|uniref:Vascular endothelial growth factor A-A n=1 Tax=Frankliniella fusca TaxID=407009 RepID=A0AAE1LM94_9NEOP|nr:Vascular endothelial growth factor A-A [Frankliniella fusca]
MMRMMGTDGTCKVPKPMVVNVKQQYPDPSKEYVPHCTILHRCTDSTGCCRSSEETCKPKASATHKVELAFYTTRVGYKEPIVEMLTFYNETECECVRTQDRFYRGSLGLGGQGASHSGSSGLSSSLASDSYYSRKQRQARTQLDMPPSYIQLAPYNKPGCRCPSTYSPRDMPQPRGCACDCFDRQTDCLRFKRGKEYFSMEDRLCIQTSQCKLPECEFGTYMKLSGRCPKKNEKFMRYSHRRP